MLIHSTPCYSDLHIASLKEMLVVVYKDLDHHHQSYLLLVVQAGGEVRMKCISVTPLSHHLLIFSKAIQELTALSFITSRLCEVSSFSKGKITLLR